MSLKDFLLKVPAVIIALSAIVLVASVAHEWTYFSVVGLEFISLLSTTDYARASLQWLPVTAGGILISIIYLMVRARYKGFWQDVETTGSSLHQQSSVRFISIPKIILGLMIIIGLKGIVFDDSTAVWDWYSFLGAIWIIIFRWFVDHKFIKERITDPLQLSVFTVVTLIAGISVWGWQHATMDMAVMCGKYRIIHSNGLIENNVHLLRSTSDGILILQVPKHEVSFLTYNSFSRIVRNNC